MPVYTFQCPKCEKYFEAHIHLKDYENKPKPKCEGCKVRLERAYLPKDTPIFKMHGIGLHRPGDEVKKRK